MSDLYIGLLVFLISIIFVAVIPYRIVSNKKLLGYISIFFILLQAPFLAWFGYRYNCLPTPEAIGLFVGLYKLFIIPLILPLITFSAFVIGVFRFLRKKPAKWYLLWSIALLFISVFLWFCAYMFTTTCGWGVGPDGEIQTVTAPSSPSGRE